MTQQQVKISSLQASRLMALGQDLQEGSAMQIYGQKSTIQLPQNDHSRSMNLKTIPDDLLDNQNSSMGNKNQASQSNQNSVAGDAPSAVEKNINKETTNTRNLKRFDTSV